MLKSLINLNKKKFSVDSVLLINLTLAFFPISFILGNFIINLNLVVFCILGIYHLKSKILTLFIPSVRTFTVPSGNFNN